jgi:glycosyltransferase involved in cell wall biosynthesis
MKFSKEEFIRDQFPNANLQSKFILFSGRINKFKKVKNLIFAMEHILKVETDIHLIIIGDGDEKTDCQKISDKLSLNKNVHFMGPIYDENIVNKYFEVADIFCIPGSVGLGIVHAFSFGLPLVTENLDYHSAEIQYLKNGYNGILVDEDDFLQLANTILENLRNPSVLQKLSNNALNTIDEEANIDNMIASYSKAIFQ